MTDVHSKEIRSYNMSKIRGKNTKPEILVRKALFSKGFRYRVHDKRLPGSPDIILPKYRIIIFVNGCFWHGHSACKNFVVPKTRTEWWLYKINTNIINDLKHIEKLERAGWKVITIWECQLKKKNCEHTIQNLIGSIINQNA